MWLSTGLPMKLSVRLSLCLLLCGVTSVHSEKSANWNALIVVPISRCIRQQVLGARPAMTLVATQRFVGCTMLHYRQFMGCTSTKKPPQRITFHGTESEYEGARFYHEETELTKPCGHVAFDALATYLRHYWYIFIDPAFVINATFSHFLIPKTSPDCEHDRLHIRTLEDFEHYSARFCGKRMPFTLIPQYTYLEFALHVNWRAFATNAGFAMFYQVVDRGEYIVTGHAVSQHHGHAPLPLVPYIFSWTDYIMKHAEFIITSLHFHVDVGCYIRAKVLVSTLSKRSFIQVLDGPSSNSYEIKQLDTAGFYDPINSIGTSLLFILNSHSQLDDNVVIIFTNQSIPQAKQSHSITVTEEEASLVVSLKQSEFCTTRHSLTYCSWWMTSLRDTDFIKLMDISIHMDIPYVYDCYFGSVWIVDGVSGLPMWKWCGFRSNELQQITSPGNRVNIKLIAYGDSGDFNITLRHVITPCVGVFPHNIDVNQFSTKVKVYVRRDDYRIEAVAGSCFVFHVFQPSALLQERDEILYFQFRGSSTYEIREFTLIRVGQNERPKCTENWGAALDGIVDSNRHVTADFSYLSALSRSPSWSQVALRAFGLTATYLSFAQHCDYDDAFMIAVQSVCDGFTMDTTFVSGLLAHPPEVSYGLRLSSACSRFLVHSVPGGIPKKVSFSANNLCEPLQHGARYPCRARDGVLCASIRSCMIHVTVTSPCPHASHDVDATDFLATVRYRWHITAHREMTFAVSFHDSDQLTIHIWTRESGHDCHLIITQRIVQSEMPGYAGITLKSVTLSECLAQKYYLDDYMNVWNVKCFKNPMKAEHISYHGELYIKVKTSNYTWLEAHDFCQRENASLASITSLQEEHVVKSIFTGASVFRPAAIYIGLQWQNGSLSWVDGRPVGITSWNRAFITGNNPHEISRTFHYATYQGLAMDTLSYPLISDWLIRAASDVLQPSLPVSRRQCALMMITSLAAPADWLMAPCDAITDPGAFLCKLKTENPGVLKHQSEIVYGVNKLQLNVTCPRGFKILFGDVCIHITVESDSSLFECDHIQNKQFMNTNTRMELDSWMFHYNSHGGFFCGSIYLDSIGDESELLSHNPLSQNNESCSVCVSEAQAVTSCPPGLFQCAENTCISAGAICDGKWDCLHGTDEAQCENTMCHINNVYQPQSFCQSACSLEKHMCLCGVSFWQCGSGGCIALSKLCDHQQDCDDASDEAACPRQKCPQGHIPCRNGQCIGRREFVDRQRQCLDGSDEREHNVTSPEASVNCAALEAADDVIKQGSDYHIPLVRMNDFIPDCLSAEDEPEYLRLIHSPNALEQSKCSPYHIPCMEHHPKCFPYEKLCVYELDIDQEMLHCRNGMHVKNCKDFACVQTFKCQSSYCIPLHYLCDGKIHCPEGEDEHYCNVTYTPICHVNDLSGIGQALPMYVQHNVIDGICFNAIVPDKNVAGLSNQLSCRGMFRCQFGQCVHPSLLCDGIIHCPLFADDETSCVQHACPLHCQCVGKAVNCTGTQHSRLPRLPSDIYLLVLKHTNIAAINLDSHDTIVKLDASFNKISFISSDSFRYLVYLTYLDLSHNELLNPPNLQRISHLVFLNISSNILVVLPSRLFYYTPYLKFLDVSGNKLRYLDASIFSTIRTLNIFSLRDNAIEEVDAKLLKHFSMVHILLTDKYQHCCLAEKVGICSSDADGFSNCESLLAKPSIKVTVYIMSAVGIIGNTFVIYNRIKFKKPHSVLIVNLAISDALYSVYLIAIVLADAYYAGSYILFDDWWRRSFLCQSLSFMSMLSSQVSIVILTCIGVERYVVVRSTVTVLKRRSGEALPWRMLPVAWAVALTTCSLHLFLRWLYNEQYAVRSSICTFLAISERSAYKPFLIIAVYVCAHGLCFVALVIIYIHIVYLSRQSAAKVGRPFNLTLFKRTAAIVISNFLCWAPLTIFILCTFSGVPVSSIVTEWMAIVIFPLSSAVNPVLYTLISLRTCKRI